jgi:tRNA (guanine37-N1)-methyltransferase
MVIIDAVIRLVPGVLGKAESSYHDSFSAGNRLLEYPQYTRPREYRGQRVPEILISGDHQAVEHWRRQQSIERTRRRRRDLLPGDSQTSPNSTDIRRPAKGND